MANCKANKTEDNKVSLVYLVYVYAYTYTLLTTFQS